MKDMQISAMEQLVDAVYDAFQSSNEYSWMLTELADYVQERMVAKKLKDIAHGPLSTATNEQILDDIVDGFYK